MPQLQKARLIMRQLRIPAVFMRGGTSKAIIFHQRDLPTDRSEWGPIFMSAIGAGDPSARQLDGMGGGVSSLSKVCIIGPPTRPDADVDYTFAQIGVTEAVVDFSGNCGNMSSAMGPFAVDEGLVDVPSDGDAVVRIHNTNTHKIIVNRFHVGDGEADVDGDMTIDGVAGTGAPIRVEFLEPGGAKTGKLLPTGRPKDVLDVPGLGRIEVSLVDAANPCVFVAASTVGAEGTELPDVVEHNKELLAKLEAIRRAGSVAMGLAPDLDKAATIRGIPKIAMIAPPMAARTLSGRTLSDGDMDITVRMISIGQPHRAVPLTGGSCLAVSTRIEGTIANELARKIDPGSSQIRIAHPSGRMIVDAKVVTDANGIARAEYAAVYRTARRLFEGFVRVRASALEGRSNESPSPSPAMATEEV
jgi:2-methylaconitate cis-trans-isomerase PrpF